MIAALAVADFRDRARRPAFVMATLAAVGLGYLAAPPASAGYTMVKVGEYRGVYDSGYLGVMLAMVGALWLSLCGFYLVKNTVARDTTTGVGQILAATPLRTTSYLLGKFLSNLLVLASMAGVLALTAPAMQLLRGESSTIDLIALWLPFVVFCLPVLALSAAAAVLFESVRPLRGGLGNIVWFFAFIAVFSAGLGSGADAIGTSLQADLLAQHPGVNTDISIGLTVEDGGLGRFVSSGLDITAGLVAQRLGYVVLAVLIAVLPALWFARFDATMHRPAGGAAPGEPPELAPAEAGAFAQTARPRAPISRGHPFRGLVAGEVRVLLSGLSRWWWLGLAGLTVAGVAVPIGDGPGIVLLAWIWPVLLWARLGTQSHEHDVHVLVGAGPSPARQLLAEWAAGVVIAALAGAGPLVRMLLTGDHIGIAAWIGGAIVIPALAILLGSASRSARLFQLVYLMLWYVAVNGAPVVDVMGAFRNGGQLAGPHPLLVLLIAAALLAMAMVTQRVRHAQR
jgi:hypothetical protein